MKWLLVLVVLGIFPSCHDVNMAACRNMCFPGRAIKYENSSCYCEQQSSSPDAR